MFLKSTLNIFDPLRILFSLKPKSSVSQPSFPIQLQSHHNSSQIIFCASSISILAATKSWNSLQHQPQPRPRFSKHLLSEYSVRYSKIYRQLCLLLQINSCASWLRLVIRCFVAVWLWGQLAHRRQNTTSNRKITGCSTHHNRHGNRCRQDRSANWVECTNQTLSRLAKEIRGFFENN